MKNLLHAGVAAAFVTAVAGPGPANARALNCADLTGGTAVAAFNVLAIVLESGDVVSWTSVNGGVNRFGGVRGSDAGNGANGSFTSSGLGIESFENNGPGTVNISCTPPGGGTTGGSASGDLGGHSQTDAVDTGIGQNAQTVFRGGNGTDVQKNSLFLTTASTQNRGRSDMNAWLSLKTRGYSGGYGGAAYDFVAGVDYLVDADTLFGALIGLGQIDINDGVTQTSATSFAVGPYFARQFNGGLMDGFLTFARPRYTTTGGAFTSARTALGFTLTGTSFRGRDNIAPYFDFRAFYEEQPAYGVVAANNIRSLRATFGMTVSAEKPLPNSGLIPYFKLAADVKSTTTTASGTDSFVYGRIGVGVAGPFVGGNLVLDVDLGKVRSDTFDGGLRVNWTIHF